MVVSFVRVRALSRPQSEQAIESFAFRASVGAPSYNSLGDLIAASMGKHSTELAAV
jgi:hypothetical protein